MPELPGQEPLPPLSLEEEKALRHRIKSEIAAVTDLGHLRALCVDKEMMVRAYCRAADKDRSDLAAARAALSELVALKDLKEEYETIHAKLDAYTVLTDDEIGALCHRAEEVTRDYESRKPAAWSAARALVATEAEGSEEA